MKKLLIDDIIAGTFLIITIFTVIINVFFRYFFNSPIKSAEEVAMICFIWSIFVGGASCFRKNMHMGIDILTHLLPEKLQRFFEFFLSIVIVVIIGIIFYLSLKFTYIARYKPTPVLGISSVYENSALVVGFGLIFIYSIKNLILKFQQVLTKKKGGKNG